MVGNGELNGTVVVGADEGEPSSRESKGTKRNPRKGAQAKACLHLPPVSRPPAGPVASPFLEAPPSDAPPRARCLPLRPRLRAQRLHPAL